jgi:hypothetical protein
VHSWNRFWFGDVTNLIATTRQLTNPAIGGNCEELQDAPSTPSSGARVGIAAVHALSFGSAKLGRRTVSSVSSLCRVALLT